MRVASRAINLFCNLKNSLTLLYLSDALTKSIQNKESSSCRVSYIVGLHFGQLLK